MRVPLVDLALLVGQRLRPQLLQLLGAQLPGTRGTLINLYKTIVRWISIEHTVSV